MRKRRVGATARSRRIVGKRATSSPQIATEMAAPLELRTPMSTAAKAAIKSADGSMATMAQWSQTAEGDRDESQRTGPAARNWGSSALRAHEALPQTPPGGNPLRPPAPFPCGLIMSNGGNLSRVRKPRPKRAPLTDSLRSGAPTNMRERGPMGWELYLPPFGRVRQDKPG
jgi:hypothetical protein